MKPIECAPCCDSPAVTNSAGVAGYTGQKGATGAAGAAGDTGSTGSTGPSYPKVIQEFIIPAAGLLVGVKVDSTAPFVLGELAFIGGANFRVDGINSDGTLTLMSLQIPGDSSGTIAAGTQVLDGPGNITPTIGTVLQCATFETTFSYSGTNLITNGDVFPVSGTGYTAFTFTPKSATSRLRFTCNGTISSTRNDAPWVVALVINSEAFTRVAISGTSDTTTSVHPFELVYEESSPGLASFTFHISFGNTGTATTTINPMGNVVVFKVEEVIV